MAKKDTALADGQTPAADPQEIPTDVMRQVKDSLQKDIDDLKRSRDKISAQIAEQTKRLNQLQSETDGAEQKASDEIERVKRKIEAESTQLIVSIESLRGQKSQIEQQAGQARKVWDKAQEEWLDERNTMQSALVKLRGQVNEAQTTLTQITDKLAKVRDHVLEALK